MEFSVPKYQYNPNEKVQLAYAGVSSGNRTVTTIRKPSFDRNRMEDHKTYGPMLPRMQGGLIATIFIGGMETTMAEMQYLIEGSRERKFTPERTSGQIADMCHTLQQKRNEEIKRLRKNPSEIRNLPPPPARHGLRRGLFLPRGYQMVPTSEPGMKIRMRVGG